MTFGVTELAVQAVVQEGLDNLRKNPHHLEFILCSYMEIPYVAKRVGPNFVRNAMEMIQKQELTVRPYFTPDVDLYPSLVVVASYAENQRFVGDYGSVETLAGPCSSQRAEMTPTVYATFDCTSIDGDEMLVPSGYELEKKIVLGMWVSNGTELAKISSACKIETGTLITLASRLPDSTSLKGWKLQSLPRQVSAEINTSLNSVNVQMALFTTGDPELHRVWAQIVRYCLKRGRKTFERYGIHNSSFSQQPMAVQEQDGPILRTTYGMECEEADAWISHDFTSIDRIDLGLEAHGEFPEREVPVDWIE